MAALEDLTEVRDYNRQFSVNYAERLVEKLIERTESLTEFPRLGRIVPEYGDPVVRELIEGRYRIMYEIVGPERLDIIHIHHHAKPLPERS